MKIAHKISLSFFLTAFLLTLSATLVNYIVIKHRHLKTTGEQIVSLVHSRTYAVNSILKSRKCTVASLSRCLEFRRLLGLTLQDKEHAILVESVRARLESEKDAHRWVKELVLVNSQGHVIASTTRESIGTSMKTHPFFTQAASSQSGLCSNDVYLSESSGINIVAFSAPVAAEISHCSRGFLIAVSDMDEVHEMMTETIGIGIYGKMAVVSKEGYIFPPSQITKDEWSIIENAFPPYRFDSDSSTGITRLPQSSPPLIFQDHKGRKALGYYEEIKEGGWRLVLTVDIKDALSPLIPIKRTIVLTIAFVPVFALLIGVFVGRLIYKPISVLQKGVELIGQGNLDHHIGTYTRDEIGDLSSAFDTMASNLKKITAFRDELTREINERIRTEKTLLIKESAISSSINAIAISDLEGNLTYINNSFLKLWGYTSPSQVLGKQNVTFWENEKEAAEISGILHKKSSWIGELTAKRQDGTHFIVQLSASMVRDAKNNPICSMASFVDITNRKSAEEALQKSEEKYRLLIENLTDLIIEIDPEGKFLFVSPSYCEMFGKKEKELLGKTFIPLVHEEDRVITLREMKKVYIPPYTCYIEQRALTRYGWRWLAWSKKSIRDHEGKVVSIVGVGRDITDGKRAEEERMEKEKLQAVLEMAGATCHELRQPMQAVLGYSELLAQDADARTAPSESLVTIIEQIERMAEIMSKLESIKIYKTRDYMRGSKILDIYASSIGNQTSSDGKES